MKTARVILVVLDSVGVGALPDAPEYGDAGSNTLGHAAKVVGGVSLPALESLGLGKVVQLRDHSSDVKIVGCYGKMAEISKGKDTTIGHWEMAGIYVDKALPVYPRGFPQELISAYEARIGTKVLGNKPASGTEIIRELGAEHCRTGYPIVYTSADSVFQVAAHEEIIPLPRLYEICKIARALLQGEHGVGRVIARPFVGRPGSFVRTHHRHDFSLEPLSETLADGVKASRLESISVGKIWDIFAGRGFTRHLDAGTNAEVIQKIREGILDPKFQRGLLFANLVDFDMLYNHRQDPKGFMDALADFDGILPSLLQSLREEDVIMITADHGNDPTDQSTDHCREYVPILVYGKNLAQNRNLGVRKTFADCGQTIAELLQVPKLRIGESFAGELRP